MWSVYEGKKKKHQIVICINGKVNKRHSIKVNWYIFQMVEHVRITNHVMYEGAIVEFEGQKEVNWKVEKKSNEAENRHTIIHELNTMKIKSTDPDDMNNSRNAFISVFISTRIVCILYYMNLSYVDEAQRDCIETNHKNHSKIWVNIIMRDS